MKAKYSGLRNEWEEKMYTLTYASLFKKNLAVTNKI